jgi:hypothetical protein
MASQIARTLLELRASAAAAAAGAAARPETSATSVSLSGGLSVQVHPATGRILETPELREVGLHMIRIMMAGEFLR